MSACFSSFARMKRSIGVFTQVLLMTAGGCGRTGAVKAQCSFHVAPSATHRLSVSICFGVSVLCEDSGGIRRAFCSCVMR